MNEDAFMSEAITDMPEEEKAPVPPTFREALRYWLRLGFISFGGPAGQISIMHQELVEQRRWISENHFLHALNFCMLLPGPEAQQLATYLGWRLHGLRGGVAAGALFVLPAALLLYGLSWLYVSGGNAPWLAGLFYGLMPAVMAVVLSALLRIGRKALKTPALWIVAIASFGAIFFGKVSFMFIILAAGVIGGLGYGLAPRHFPANTRSDDADEEEQNGTRYLKLPPVPRATWGRALRIILLCVTLWWLPVIALGAWLGWESTPAQEGVFFSKAAMVTFGGAYAVLPYVAQQAVEQHHWLTHPQMMTGLGLAETTPGPLIMVLQFVGFMGGWNQPGALAPWQSATLGAAITTWATFVPCFLMIFLGAPHVEQLRAMPRVSAALTAITAAVTGVILNLAVWFAWHALWPTGWRSETGSGLLGGMDAFVAVTALIAFALVEKKRWKIGLMPVLIGCALLGMAWKLLAQ